MPGRDCSKCGDALLASQLEVGRCDECEIVVLRADNEKLKATALPGWACGLVADLLQENAPLDLGPRLTVSTPGDTVPYHEHMLRLSLLIERLRS